MSKIVLRRLQAGGSNPLVELDLAWTDWVKFAWSPDGSMLAYYDTRHGLRVMDRNGSFLYPVSPDEPLSPHLGGEVLDASWSPNGKSIAFVLRAREGTVWRLQTVAPDGTHQATLFEASGGNQHVGISRPAWSPSGDRVYFAHYHDPATGYRSMASILYSVAPDGSDHRRLAVVPAEYIAEIRPSPDGGTLLLVGRNHHDFGQPLTRFPTPEVLYLVGSDGLALRQIRSGHLWASWSAAGDQIAVFNPHHSPHSDALYTLRADGSPGRVLVQRSEHGRPEPAHGREVNPWEPVIVD